MSAYMIFQLDIHDAEGYKKYAEGARPLMAGYDCVIIAVDEAVKVLEGTWPRGKTVIIRFNEEAEALRWYNSAEYQAVARLRLVSTTTNSDLIRGQS
jgi:uncharacterized protein (DUF1330 family)